MVLSAQREALAEHGGQDGIRDMGMLDSALARPQNLLAYAEKRPSLTRLAAAYAFALAKNHPFVDGNKRAALIVSFAFLDLNGLEVTAGQEDAYLMMDGLAAGRVDEDEFAAWLEAHCARIP